jgi:hypothetical protein
VVAGTVSARGRWVHLLTDDRRLHTFDALTGERVAELGVGAPGGAACAALGVVAHPTSAAVVTWCEEAALRAWVP